MKSKVLLVFAVFLLAVSFVPESEAFTAGGGGNIPRGAKREFQVSLQNSYVSFYPQFSRVTCCLNISFVYLL